MNELRRDTITGRWIIILKEGEMTPEEFEVERHERKGSEGCPFCPGREEKTPPEIDAHREGGTAANKPGWSTRVIPNKFPALGIEGELDKVGIGVYDMMNGIGAHEVIIETPDHSKTLSQLDEAAFVRYLDVVARRLRADHQGRTGRPPSSRGRNLAFPERAG